jgi:hypothetical protein
LSFTNAPEEEKPATDLTLLLMRLVDLTATIRVSGLADGGEAVYVLGELLQMEDELALWESQIKGHWVFQTLSGDFPPAACFKGRYHIYSDNWTSRVWNFYRWARLMVCSALLDMLGPGSGYPIALASRGLSNEAARAAQEAAVRETAMRIAEDTLVSVPSHWKHPSLNAAQREKLRVVGYAGTGAVGVPGLLFHIDVAASLVGVPKEWSDWSVALLDAVWSDMGMAHARRIADSLRDRLQRRKMGQSWRPSPAGISIALRASEPVIKTEVFE